MAELKDRVCELKCNIDDMTAEELAFAAQQLMTEGARDVTITPVIMKKGRPASLLTVMCADDEQEKERFARLIFQNTSTIGIRAVVSERWILGREAFETDTPCGPVRYKCVSGYGTRRFKIEYEDLARIAESRSSGISAAREAVMPYVQEDYEKRAGK